MNKEPKYVSLTVSKEVEELLSRIREERRKDLGLQSLSWNDFLAMWARETLERVKSKKA